MLTQPAPRFILAGSSPEAGTIYVAEPGARPAAWMAYDLRAGGALANPRPVVAAVSANWRGLPELR